ncbi:FtsK/SpoIIIE domain-containing protein [Arthrobacter sp. AB6]|uniref:FtsK/SpoIIIE domain-containing protein n=1 Tax=Arthrobacter sp. AB6 TaxID=2962570 RepID=UPI00288262C4|nr:FtsK/SpoIIIE domain-containing protein [Arthrobacter sp. AB6]MDT0197336.1 FtsK/SpoIIIE domain-containing protein [Arthrobacter sp. AB6]
MQAIARNHASQAVIEHSIRARDIANSLSSSGTAALDVAEYITLGKLSTPGAPMGVNTEIEAPLVVPLIGRGNIVIEADHADARRLVECIVWEALRGTAPGQLDIIGYDPKLRSVLAPFSALRRVSDESLQVLNRPAELDSTVQQLVADVQRVNETLRGVSGSLVDFRRSAGHPVERYRLAVLFDYPSDMDEQLHRQVMALAKAGPDAGLSFVFVLPAAGEIRPDWWRENDMHALGAVLRQDDEGLRWTTHPKFRVRLAGDDATTMVKRVDELAANASNASAPRIPFTRVQPLNPTWTSSSADRLEFTFGLLGPSTVTVMLGDEQDQRHNILITGAVGQGKSNLLKVIIHSLAQRYSPEELELYLLDFKEGVTLYPMAPTPGAPDFLPHARVLGLESDRDFGLAVLRHIEGEFMRRAKLFRPYGDSISRYRAAVPDAVMPRIVVVIDEFHMLFEPNDKTSEAAAQLLEAIARRGRSYGVHLILASQTISGMAALMAREGGIFAQFPIRLALKNAVQESFATLGSGNDGAARLRARGEAVLNLDYGHIDSNRQVVVAAADDQELSHLRHGWWEASRSRVQPPVVFDGGRRIRATDALPALHGLRRKALAHPGTPAALIGYPIGVSSNALTVSFGAEPGRNFAILGAGEDARQVSAGDEPVNNAIGVLHAAALSLALQHPEGNAEFISLEALDDTTFKRNNHHRWLDVMTTIGYPVERVTREKIAGYLQELASELETRDNNAPPKYLLGFGLDRATTLDTPDMFSHRPSEDLQQILRTGPAKRTHLLGWWANAATFKSHIGFGGEGFIDAILMLRIDQSTVQELLSSPFVTWSVRDNRGLFADRTQLPEPTTVIPFSPLTARDTTELGKTDWEV